MGRKTYKPTTPGIRHQVRLTWDTEGGVQEVPKFLRESKNQTGGRNNRGRITSYHRGGGNKRRTREVRMPTSVRTVDGVVGKGQGEVVGIQYDPNRTARLALVEPRTPGVRGESARPHYMIASKGLEVGSKVNWASSYEKTGEDIVKEGGRKRTVGSTVFLRDVSVGTSVYNLELSPRGGGKRVRAAGAHARVQRKTEEEAFIRLPSGQVRRFSLRCRATVGAVGGEDHHLEVIGKAGKMRHRSVRPTVRGCAMNPVDHPHGGRTRGGRPSMTPWSRVAKGQPTRKKRSVFVVW